MGRPNGFTIVEMLIAMAIATFLIAGAMTAHVSNLGFYKTTETRSTLYQDSLLLIDFLRGELMQAGGGSIRAWMGIWVEDDCAARAPLPACGDSDRVTLTTLTIPMQECAITGQPAVNAIQVAFSAPGVCCLQPQAAGESSFLNRHIMLTLGDYYTQAFATAVDLNTCRLTYSSGQAAPNNMPPPSASYSNGAVSLVSVQTLYLDTGARMLRRFSDVNNNGAIDGTESVIIADGVFDLQLALGYDFNVPDGNIAETADGLNDEWLYNAPTLIEAFGLGYFVSPPLTRSALLTAQVSVILGSDQAEGGVSAGPRRILNGPPRSQSGWILMEESARLSPRNSYIFQ